MFENIQGFTLKLIKKVYLQSHDKHFAPLSSSVSSLEDTEKECTGVETKERNGWLSHLLVLGEMLGGAGL